MKLKRIATLLVALMLSWTIAYADTTAIQIYDNWRIRLLYRIRRFFADENDKESDLLFQRNQQRSHIVAAFVRSFQCQQFQFIHHLMGITVLQAPGQLLF